MKLKASPSLTIASLLTINLVLLNIISSHLSISLAAQITISAIVTLVLSYCLIYYFVERPSRRQHQLVLETFGDDASTISDKPGASIAQLVDLQFSRFSSAGKNINDSASELAINSAEIAYFLDQLSLSIVSSGQDVNRIAIAAEELSANTKEINDNAASASQLANQAMSACGLSATSLSENVITIHKLNNEVLEVSEKVKSLAVKASEIQNITDVIDSIASQTNLLALNAAIEAARAGEQGRGFAVVADEVRALASKTADATNKIGTMLNQITSETEQTSDVMAQVVGQTSDVVVTMDKLSLSLSDINQLVTESSGASDQISLALQQHDSTTSEISNSIVNIRDFLQNKSGQTHDVSVQASRLSTSAEAIFVQLVEFNTGSLLERMYQEVQLAAQRVGEIFEQGIASANIGRGDLFDFNYVEVANTNPAKYSTKFDRYTDQVLPSFQDGLLKEFGEMIYAGAVDINGYFPTHNTKFSQPLTGNHDIDFANNRTKRIFDDPTGSRCGKHTEKFLLQTYKRDTGEIMHDVSAPIFVNGKHWGGFRIGFKAQSTALAS